MRMPKIGNSTMGGLAPGEKPTLCHSLSALSCVNLYRAADALEEIFLDQSPDGLKKHARLKLLDQRAILQQASLFCLVCTDESDLQTSTSSEF